MERSSRPRGIESERRAPTVARSEISLQPNGFRDHVQAFEAGLDPLEPRERRLVRVLVAQLASWWIGMHGPSHRTLIAEVAMRPQMLRVDVHCEPPIDDPGFWEELVSPHAEDVLAPWAIDRRRSSGVWFELAWAGDQWTAGPASDT